MEQQELYDALRAADAAGDTVSAAQITNYILTLDNPPEASSTFKEKLAAPAQEIASMASSVLAAPVANTMGLAGMGVDYFSGIDVDPRDIRQQVLDSLTYTPPVNSATKAVQDWNPLAAAGRIIGVVANTAGDLVDIAPESAWSQAAGDAVREGIPQALSIFGARSAAKVPAKQATLNIKKLQNAHRDAIIASGKSRGYRFLPSDLGKSATMERLLGATELASRRGPSNSALATNLIRKEMGLTETTPLSLDTLSTYRATQGKAYEAARNSGVVDLSPSYFTTLAAIDKPFVAASKAAPLLKNKVSPVINIFRQDKTGTPLKAMDASTMVDLIKVADDKATAAFAGATPNKAQGRAYAASAKTLKAELAASLRLKGLISVADDFDAATINIAKSYEIQKALKGDALNPASFAASLKKGKPLSGAIRDIAELQNLFPNMFKADTAKGLSRTDALIDAGSGLTGLGLTIANPASAAITIPAVMGTVLARPLGRSYMLSPSGQARYATPNYSASYVPSAAQMGFGQLGAGEVHNMQAGNYAKGGLAQVKRRKRQKGYS